MFKILKLVKVLLPRFGKKRGISRKNTVIKITSTSVANYNVEFSCLFSPGENFSLANSNLIYALDLQLIKNSGASSYFTLQKS